MFFVVSSITACDVVNNKKLPTNGQVSQNGNNEKSLFKQDKCMFVEKMLNQNNACA